MVCPSSSQHYQQMCTSLCSAKRLQPTRLHVFQYIWSPCCVSELCVVICRVQRVHWPRLYAVHVQPLPCMCHKLAESCQFVLQLLHATWCCSRCTGYRPILDAFKVFAKADPAAYTEESISACKGMQLNGHASEAPPATGHGADGNAGCANGHAANGEVDSNSIAEGHKGEQHAENGHCHGDVVSKGTVKELTKASNSNGSKVSQQHLAPGQHCSLTTLSLPWHLVL